MPCHAEIPQKEEPKSRHPPQISEKRERFIFWKRIRESLVSYIACASHEKASSSPAEVYDFPTGPAKSVPVSTGKDNPKAQSHPAPDSKIKEPAKVTFALKDPSEAHQRNMESSKTLVREKEFDSYQDIFAEYKLSKHPIGSGTFAVVYKGLGVADGQDYALKFIDKKALDDFGDCYHLIAREINILKEIKHERCLSLYRTFETKEAIVLVTDFAHGGELLSRFHEVEEFNEGDASKLMRQLLEGLLYLHDKRIVHRDIKPENLLLKDYTPRLGDGKLVIADFGLAKELAKKLEPLHTACGTLNYVAPEVLAGGGYSTPADIWSCGIVMYFLLSGYTPFQGSSESALMESAKTGAVQFLEEDWEEISSEAREFIGLLLNPDPTARITARQALEHPWLNHSQTAPESFQSRLTKKRESQALLRSALVKLRAVQQFNHLLDQLIHESALNSPSLAETPTNASQAS